MVGFVKNLNPTKKMRLPVPPVIVASLLAALLILYLSGWRPIGTLIDDTWRLMPALLLFAGGAITVVSTARRFARNDSQINTFKKPRNLVTDGLFAYTRNPIYLGFTLLLLGAAVAANSVVALFAPIAFFVMADRHYIPFEEKTAEETFGDPSLNYTTRVRRWL